MIGREGHRGRAVGGERREGVVCLDDVVDKVRGRRGRWEVLECWDFSLSVVLQHTCYDVTENVMRR